MTDPKMPPNVRVHRAVLDWIKHDAGVAMKMSITPDMANALSARILSALEVVEDDVLERAWMAGRDAAAATGGIWLRFNSEGEPTGEYCTVEAFDPGDMTLWVRRDKMSALTPPNDLRATLTKGSTDDRT